MSHPAPCSGKRPPLPPAQSSAPKRRKVALDDDEFLDQLDAIIRRDFYPDISRMERELQWLRAVAAGDPQLIRVVQAMLDSSPNSRARLSGETETKAPNMSLDKYVQRYQSEDDEAFQLVMKREAAQKLKKLEHFMNPRDPKKDAAGESTRPTLTQHGEGSYAPGAEANLKAVTHHRTDGYGTGGQSPYNMQSWQSRPKSAFFFNSKDLTAARLTASEAAVQLQGRDKEIVAANTRFPRFSTNHPRLGTPLHSASGAASTLPSSSSATSPPVDQPTSSYGTSLNAYVATPNPNPEMERSPLMTWGVLAGTPVRLDDAGGGGDVPGFQVPAESEMDRVARELAQQARQRLRKRKLMYEGSAYGAGSTPTPKTTVSGLSRTAQQMLSRTTPKGTDTQLRASYGITPTPKRATPTPKVHSSTGKARGKKQARIHSRYTPTPPPSR